MTGDRDSIDRIVAEVVKRLSEPAPPSPRPATRQVPVEVELATAAPHELVLDARVVTTATMHGRLQGVRCVIVDRRAVVTPSVKDELRKRGIHLEYRESNGGQVTTADLRVVRCCHAPEALRAAATLPLPEGAEEGGHDELTAAANECSDFVADTRRVAVLLSHESLAAVCLLNRSTHVRAASARRADEVRQAISAIGANVLVVDPRDVTANQWNAMLRLFRSHLPRGCPPGLPWQDAQNHGQGGV